MSTPAPIPIPLRQRWQDARRRLFPLIIFAITFVLLLVLWKDFASAPTMVGQVESIQANVSCYKPGMLAQLNVNRFQKVKAGDAVGQVLLTDPKILASSLAVVQADIEMLRVTMQPIAAKQRTAMDYSQLRLDWMRQRAQLAMARANLQFAQTDFHRTEQLFTDKIVSERFYDQAKASQGRLQNEVEELTRLVEEQGRNIDQLQLTNAVEISKVTEEPLRVAIAAQEAKLRLTEAELSPITLYAPVDGMVNVIYHRTGEAVNAGESIVSIAPVNALRIVGYLRPPIFDEPKVGCQVQVRTRGPRRQSGTSAVVEVGAQFETIAPALQAPMKLANIELGLPIGISVPANLKIRPGELVDLTLLQKTE
ncbi:MAG TPA: HlyD family efflux transporter periplasmic adaptor subunit [Candidatus Binatia bacterium]|jgi:multidrug resistance efflux pump|nr:HlyD family efflux transporter periplasmic adaptor subunit [Candidatus Binatia bacterium]